MLESLFYYFPPSLTLLEFFELGGPVLYLIGLVGLLMWGLVIERVLFIYSTSRLLQQHIVAQWVTLVNKSSWTALQVRAYWLSLFSQRLNHHLILIKTCIAVAPLLGLLGTVTGMIEVFDVMGNSGLGNTRAMSSGIAKATIPTMAGMVISLSGFMIITFIQQKINSERKHLTQQLTQML